MWHTYYVIILAWLITRHRWLFLQLLEQEKYALRKRLNTIEIEYENKVHDLHSELNGTRAKLNVHLEISKQNEAESSRIIGELTEQNQRLTNELKKVLTCNLITAN